MTATPAMTERHAALLSELAELGMSVARELEKRIGQAETPEAAAGLAGAFHRVARSVRMTLALEAKVRKDGEAEARAAEIRRGQAVTREAIHRRFQVKAVVARQIRAEYEREAAERWIEALVAEIQEQSLDEAAFVEGPIEATIARIRAGLGLAANDAAPPGRPAARGRAGRRSSA